MSTENVKGSPPDPEAKIAGTILFVDDETAIQDVCQQLLQHFGYRVIPALRGQEAVELYREQNHEIDLVILDMKMPGMGGRVVFDQLKRINPQVIVLVMTGSGETDELKAMLAQGVKGVLDKPFQFHELAEAVARMLNPIRPVEEE